MGRERERAYIKCENNGNNHNWCSPVTSEMIQQLSSNKDTEDSDRSHNKEYGKSQRPHIWPKNKPSLKEKFLKQGKQVNNQKTNQIYIMT